MVAERCYNDYEGSRRKAPAWLPVTRAGGLNGELEAAKATEVPMCAQETAKLSRRDFAKLVGMAGASAALAAIGDAGFDAGAKGAGASASHDVEMAQELGSGLSLAPPTAQPR
jgi:hypothetical protein